MTAPAPFDDYLGLARRSFAGCDAVSFHGRSGSGKSSAIAWLLEHHPDFRGEGAREAAVLDDLLGPHQVPTILRRLRHGRRVLAACHFHPRWLLPLRLRWRVASFDLDRIPAKVERRLDDLGIPYTGDAVAVFCRRFGANYTDLEIVLEYARGPSFDAALDRFLRECRVERVRDRRSLGQPTDGE